MKKSLGLVAGVVVLSGFAAVAQAAERSDSWITARVKLALLTGDDVTSTSVHVDTLDGQVTIHGKVHGAAEKTRAENITRGVEGVREVRDLLQVVPKPAEKRVGMTDDRIEKSVSKILKEEPSLKDSGIGVKSVDKGVVLLSGKTDSLEDYLRAVECAHAVPGVRGVFSEVQGPKGALEQKEQPHGRSDSYITAATKLRLFGDSKVPALDVKVDTDNGVVTLFGTVPSEIARSAAAADARKVDGVTAVANELQVVPDSRKKEVKADDKQIRASVEAAFQEHDIAHVDVAVENGVVRLTGTVPTIWTQLKAATVARASAGVRAVNDDLHVGE